MGEDGSRKKITRRRSSCGSALAFPLRLRMLSCLESGGKTAAIQKRLLRLRRWRFLGWEFVFPAGDYYRGQAIAEDVYAGAAHVHQLVDGEEQEERLRREMEGSGGGENDDQRRAGYAGSAFAADEQGEEHDRLLGNGEMDAGGLGDEEQRERLVEAGAVKVEAVAGGENEGDGIAGNAEGFHFFHGSRESGLGTGSGEGDGDRLSGGAQESLDRDACD